MKRCLSTKAVLAVCCMVLLIGCQAAPSAGKESGPQAPVVASNPPSETHSSVAPEPPAPPPREKTYAYRDFDSLREEMFDGFQPKGFLRFSDIPYSLEYYTFDPKDAWGKRNRTVVDQDDRKPSQFRYTYETASKDIAVVAQFMYTSLKTDRDVIGLMTLPIETNQQDRTITPPADSMELFMYHNIIVWLRCFPTADQEHTPELEMKLIQTRSKFGQELRGYLDSWFAGRAAN